MIRLFHLKIIQTFLFTIITLSGFLLFSKDFESPSIPKTLHIVFDLDWTLIYGIKDNSEQVADVVLGPQEAYKFADGAAEIIEALLAIPGVRISFFSGGPAKRNETVLRSLILPSGRTAHDIAHKILSKEDLDRRESVSKSNRFSLRYRKNPTKIDANTENILMMEDSPEFIDRHQQNNVVWIGAPYEYVDRPDLIKDPSFRKGKIFLPNNEADWVRERTKLIWGFGILVTLIDKVISGESKSLVEANIELFGDSVKTDSKANPGSEALSKYLTVGYQRLATQFPTFKALRSFAKAKSQFCREQLKPK